MNKNTRPSAQIDPRIAWHTEQAKTFKTKGNYEAACRAYENALELIPDALIDLRAKVLTQLSLAGFDAGQSKRAAQWAEQAVGLQPSAFLIHAHSAAGIAYSARGMLADSERHRTMEYEIASIGGNQEQIAASLSHLMLVKKHIGKLDEALRYCEETPDCLTPRSRIMRHVHSECLLAKGRFQESWEQLNIAMSGPAFPDSAGEARFRAVLEVAQGQVEGAWALSGADGDPAFHAYEAERLIQSALAHLGSDPKMRLWCEAALTWVLALNQKAQSREICLAA